MAVRTWVGRFCVADGRVEEEGPWLTSVIRDRSDDEPDELYVLVEPLTTGAEEFSGQLVDVIAQLYRRDPLSLTGALTRSLRAAHEHLRDWNKRSLPEHRVGAGSTCLAVRGADVYIAQVGPSIAYVRRSNGEVRRYHAEQNDLSHALGLSEQFEPRLRRVTLEPGDILLAGSTQLEQAVPREHLERILAKGADDALPELYLLGRDRPNLAIVLISCFEEAPDEQPPGFLTRAGEERPVEATAATAEAVGTAEQMDATPAAVQSSRRSNAPLAIEAAEGLAVAGVATSPAVHEQIRAISREAAPPPLAGVRLRGENAKPTYKRTTGLVPAAARRVPRLAAAVIVALAAIGGIAYAYLPGSIQESRNTKFERLVAQAREANARAQASADRSLKRQLLNDAHERLADAASIHARDPDVTTLQSDVAAALAVLDAVTEVKPVTTVVDLAQSVTGELSATAEAIGGGYAYLLDASGHRVIAAPLDGSTAPQTVLAEGQVVADRTVGRPAYFAWAEQTHSLIIVDDRRQAFAWYPASGGALPLVVRAFGEIGSVDAIAASGGNLYIVDLRQNQVWRYLPGEGGFDSERAALLASADLHDVSEIAVGPDIYVLDAKRGIRRFVGKTEVEFKLAGIDTPLKAPASLSVLPGSGRIVVVDRGNKRIVLASSDGVFLRQLVSPAFTDIRAVSVDEGTRTMYVLNGDVLLKAAFPP
jgi:hypothetical protein